MARADGKGSGASLAGGIGSVSQRSLRVAAETGRTLQVGLNYGRHQLFLQPKETFSSLIGGTFCSVFDGGDGDAFKKGRSGNETNFHRSDWKKTKPRSNRPLAGRRRTKPPGSGVLCSPGTVM